MGDERLTLRILVILKPVLTCALRTVSPKGTDLSITREFCQICVKTNMFLEVLNRIKPNGYWLTLKTSQELRMLSRSLCDCQSTIQIAVSVVIVVIVVSVY